MKCFICEKSYNTYNETKKCYDSHEKDNDPNLDMEMIIGDDWGDRD